MIPWINLVSDETREARYSMCKACDKYTSLKTCSICNCVMPVKTVWADAECPEGKWGTVSADSSQPSVIES